MNNQIQTKMQDAPVNPFSSPDLNAGAVAVESTRATAEAAGQIRLAKMFPRSMQDVQQEIIETCKNPALAQSALYAYPRGGQTVTGPSIRLAEELCRIMGNIKYGIVEMSRNEGKSEMMAYAWDMEKNTISEQKFAVRHLRDKRGGAQQLKEERDIYEVTANMGARRLRARILSIIPPHIVDLAVAECQKTAQGANDMPMAQKIAQLLSLFDKVGVTKKQIENRIGHPVDEMTSAEGGELMSIVNSIRDGNSGIRDWFEIAQAKVNLAEDGFDPSKPKTKPQNKPVQNKPSTGKPENF